MSRAYNFSPGPAALPEAVLRQAQAEMLEFGDAGASIVELSHRGPEFLEVARQTEADLRQANLEALAASQDKNLTIYVHGANTGVQRAAAQAAQYRHFTGRNSVVLSYIWPSAESFLRFSTDVANTARTAPTFAHLIRMLSLHTRARQINVIAYSSGAMVASGGLA